jgi:hypothetical protein
VPPPVPILQSSFLLLIFKLMFKGESQCMPTVGVLYFGSFNPFHYSPLPLYLPLPIFQQLSIHTLISSTFTCYVLWYYWCSIILFSLPSFPEFQRVVLHLSLYIIMLVLCVCLSFVSTTYERKRGLCVSEPGLLHLTWCPPFASIYLQTTYHYSLWLSRTPLCMHTTFSWSIHQL